MAERVINIDGDLDAVLEAGEFNNLTIFLSLIKNFSDKSRTDKYSLARQTLESLKRINDDDFILVFSSTRITRLANIFGNVYTDTHTRKSSRDKDFLKLKESVLERFTVLELDTRVDFLNLLQLPGKDILQYIWTERSLVQQGIETRKTFPATYDVDELKDLIKSRFYKYLNQRDHWETKVFLVDPFDWAIWLSTESAEIDEAKFAGMVGEYIPETDIAICQKTDDHTATRIHELLHSIGQFHTDGHWGKAFKNNPISEGFTEYFTISVCLENGLDFKATYVEEMRFAAILNMVLGEDATNFYFGKIDTLFEAGELDPKIFKSINLMLEAEESKDYDENLNLDLDTNGTRIKRREAETLLLELLDPEATNTDIRLLAAKGLSFLGQIPEDTEDLHNLFKDAHNEIIPYETTVLAVIRSLVGTEVFNKAIFSPVDARDKLFIVFENSTGLSSEYLSQIIRYANISEFEKCRGIFETVIDFSDAEPREAYQADRQAVQAAVTSRRVL